MVQYSACAVDLHVGGGRDLAVDGAVDGVELAQALGRGREALLLRRALPALLGHALAELHEAVGRLA